MDAWIENEAIRNGTSANAEIRRCVRVMMDEQTRREKVVG
jgi:hypothetical protein